MTLMTEDRALLLAEKARKAAADMRRTVEGKAPSLSLGTNAGSLAALANMLSDLSSDMIERRARDAAAVAALTRIANLQIRGAAALIERGDWKRITEEVQAIATDAIKPG